jgi:transposase
MLTDELWSKLKAILLEDRVYNKLEHRQTMEGILGCPWRDLPECFGLWNTVYRRFLLWSKNGILMRLFKSLSANSEVKWEFIDGSYVKAHQHSTGDDVHDSKVANELIELLPQGDFVIADKGYDSEVIRDKIRERNSSPCNT